jgi:hypothetical protein
VSFMLRRFLNKHLHHFHHVPHTWFIQISMSTEVLELSTRNFYDEFSLSTTIRGTQTQLKNGGLVLMKLE